MTNSEIAHDTPGISGNTFYRWFLVFIAGMGGLLYGIDVGIIAAALLYLGKTVNLTIGQTSVLVAAVLGGSMLSSPVAGMLADWFGRRKIMIASGLMFVISVALIVISQGFVTLFLGRLLQGMSGGVIAVVVPLYLAESLEADSRGRGAAVFQFMLTFGIALAALIGWFYTHQAQIAIAFAHGNAGLIRAAENHAWRGMFLAVIYPGLLFFAGTFFLSESPRWLLRKGRQNEALKALERSVSEAKAATELHKMQSLLHEKQAKNLIGAEGSLLQRKYVIPFLLACIILACNQATGINSILGFLVVILKQAGMSATHATQGDVIVKLLNCGMTIVAIVLVDRKGRKFLLEIGTAGIIIALFAGGLFFLNFEARRVDVKREVAAAQVGNKVILPVSAIAHNHAVAASHTVLTVLYSYGHGNQLVAVPNEGDKPVLEIQPNADAKSGHLTIKKAFYGPVPTEGTGWLITVCLAIFIAAYSVGPGVVVWLTLSELMPTRIRSTGMGIALLLNQGVSTLIAAVFLPVVGNYGYHGVFFFWGACTVIYFITATFFLPETKGKSLEEIEMYFEGGNTK